VNLRNIDSLAKAFVNAGIINYEEGVSLKHGVFLRVKLIRHTLPQLFVFFTLFANRIEKAIWADEDRVVDRSYTPSLESPMKPLISSIPMLIPLTILLVIIVSILPGSKS
jgi:hypothetical protein